MEIEELDVPESLKQALKRRGYRTLYPPQEEAIKNGVLEGKNLLLTSPTASGKTLIAILAIFKKALTEGAMSFYLTPLRALASEKYEEIKSLGDELGLRVALSIGDYDSDDPWLERYDIVVSTNEKVDSLLRHKPSWMSKLGAVVLDEIHLVNSEKRGPTLEMVIARLKTLPKRPQIIALSATVRNAKEIGEWLNAEIVATEWRPVALKEGVYYDGEIEYSNGETVELDRKADEITDLVASCLEGGGQALVFAPTRRTAVAKARKLAVLLRRLKVLEPRRENAAIASDILAAERNKITELLAETVKRGVAFHHAGLSYPVRRIIEKAFRENILKVIVATPTLAAGVNLPARRVIISDYRRYNVELGYYERISVMEYKQMAGRAGRPKYDKYGEAILLAKTLEEKDFLLETYILAPPERITSKLSSEPALRAHLLATVASGYASTLDQLRKIFTNTLCYMQYGQFNIDVSTKAALQFLVARGFIRSENGTLEATEIGRLTSSLYIDPLSAAVITEHLSASQKASVIGYLHLLAATPDMPKLYLRRKERERYEELLEEHLRGELLIEPPINPYDYEFYLAELKTALLLYDWIEETPDDVLIEKYNVGTGDIYSLTQSAEWLAYAASRLANALGLAHHYVRLANLRHRIKHGVKEELLELVSIKGIGRVRARALYSHGYKTILDLQKASPEELARIPTIGPTIAAKIKAYLRGEASQIEPATNKPTLEQYM